MLNNNEQPQIPKANSSRLRRVWHWFGTSYEPEFAVPQDAGVRYCIWQKERCPTTGRLHYQIYAEFFKAQRLTQVKRLLGEGNWKPREGTREGCRRYCSKEASRVEGPWEYGNWERGGQGSRNDLRELKDAIDQGASLLECFELSFSNTVRYNRGLSTYMRLRRKKDIPTIRDLKIIWLYGNSGSGKTYWCYKEYPQLFKLTMHKDSVWFDDYDFEKVLLLDEFYGQLKYNLLLQVLDVYELRIEIKFGFTFAAWNVVLITSQHPPTMVYQGVIPDLKYHLYRRLLDYGEIYHVENRTLTPKKLVPNVGTWECI